MLYWTLLAHRWKHLWRSGAKSARLLRLGALFFFGGYFAFSLVATGYIYPHVVQEAGAQLGPLALLNAYLFTAAFGYLGLRFFVQRALKMRLRPYLPRPIPEWPLVHFAQVASLGSLLNVFPFFFIAPVWGRLVWHGPYGAGEAAAWLAGFTLLVFLTHYASSLLRLMIVQDARRFFWLVGGVLLLAVLDVLFLNGRALAASSAYTFAALLEGRALVLAGLLATTLLVYAASARRLYHSLRADDEADVPLFRSRRLAGFAAARGATVNLMLLDLRMIMRNKRPRSVIGMAALFGVAYPPVLLFMGAAKSLAGVAFLGLFALILGASSYGQYLFSWDSQHFDGLLVRVRDGRTLVRARLFMLYLFPALTAALLLPLFVALVPWAVPAFLCVLAYVLGVAATALLFVGFYNSKPIRLARGGAFNYEGLSTQQFLVNIPVFLPPALLFLLLDARAALLIVGGLGLAGLLLFPAWTLLFARLWQRRRHRMAASFRSFGE